MAKKKVAPVSEMKKPEEKKERVPKPAVKPIIEHNKAWRVANGIQNP